jgi:hypothetical protein
MNRSEKKSNPEADNGGKWLLGTVLAVLAAFALSYAFSELDINSQTARTGTNNNASRSSSSTPDAPAPGTVQQTYNR